MQLPKTKVRAGKRFLALTLVICMVLSMFVGSVSAVKDDVSGHWAEKQIRTWVEQGLVNGYSDGTVRPDAAITRGEFCAIVNRVFGFGEAGAISFTDVPESHWAYKQVAIATKVGYMTGLGNGNFGPDKPITRQEMAVVIARLLERSAVAGNGGYTDAADMASWAKGAIAALAEDGTMNGYPDGTFRPEKNVTRAEGIVALSKVAGIEVDEDVVEEEEEDDNTGTGSGIVGPGTGSGSGVVPGPGTSGGSGGGSTTPDIPSIPDPKPEEPEVPEQPEQPAEKKDELYSDTTPYGRFLTYNGKAEAQILLPKDASEYEKLAAQEMQDNLELVTGAKLPINTGYFSGKFNVELPNDLVTVDKKGYYPVTVNIKNFTSKDKVVTLTHANAEAGMPELIIQGSKGLEEGQVAVSVGSTVHVNALVKVEDPKAFGEYIAQIAVEADGETVDTLELEVRAGGNYLDVGDFETSVGSWTGGQRNTAFRMAGEAAFQTTGNPAYGEKLELNSGSLYMLSFWVMKTVKSDFKVRVRDYDADGNAIDPAMSLYSTFSANGRWTYYEYRFIANTGDAEDYAYSMLDFIGEGELWLDNISLVYCGEATNTIPATTGEFTKGVRKSVKSYTFPPTSAESLLNSLLDSGILEYDDIPGWYCYAQTHLTEDSYVGEYACDFYCGMPTWHVLLSVRNPIADDLGTYTLSFWAKGPGDGASFGEVRVKHSYVNEADSYSEILRFYPGQEWERYEMTFTPEERGSEYDRSQFQFISHGMARADDPATAADESLIREAITLDHIACYNTESASILSADNEGFELPAGNQMEEGSSELKLLAGYPVRLGVWLKGASAGTANISIKDYNGSGKALTTPASLNTAVEVTTDWAYHEMYFIPNPSFDSSYDHSELVVTGAEMKDIELVYCDQTKELVSNGDFEASTETDITGSGTQAHPDWRKPYTNVNVNTFALFNGWHFNGASQKDTGYAGNGLKSVNPTAFPYSLYKLQYQDLMSTTAGKDYVLTFWAKTESGVNLDMKVSFKESPEQSANVTLTDEWQMYQLIFTAKQTSNAQNKLVFLPDVRVTSAEDSRFRAQIWLDQVSFMEVPAPVVDDSTEDVVEPMPAQPALDMPQNSGLNILICTDESLPAIKSVFADDLTWLAGADGFAVRQRGSTIYIFGDNADGALNGVYDFLEENAGTLFIRAHDTAYKAQPSLATKRTDYREKPTFAKRSWHTVGVNEYNQYFADYDTEIMLRRNKINHHTANIGMEWAFDEVRDNGLYLYHTGHNITYWIQRSSTYNTADLETQKEYWCIEDPDFIEYKEGEMDSIWRQINFWNPATKEAVLESVREYLDTYPELTTVGISQMDTYYYAAEGCYVPFEYEPGKFVYPDVENFYESQMNEENKYFFSTVFFTWLNDIAEELAKTHPDVMINTGAYYTTEVPPACGVHENISITFCPIYENLHDSIYDESDVRYNVPTMERYTAWRDSGKVDMSQFGIYNYFGCFTSSQVYERPLWDEMQELLKLYAADGVGHIRPEGTIDGGSVDDPKGTNNWSMNTMTYWIFHQLAWNPYQDIDLLIDKYCDTVYGDAAPYMRQYYDFLEQGWDKGELDIQHTTVPREMYNNFIIRPGVASDIQTALDNAWKAVEGQPLYQERIRYIKETYEQTQESLGLIKEEKGTALYTTASTTEILNDFDFENSPIWKDAQVLTNFFNSATLQPWEGWYSKVRLLWDEEYIYVAYENFDDGIEDIEVTPGLVGGWYDGRADDVETFITVDDTLRSYYQYSIAPRTPGMEPNYVPCRWMYSGGYRRYDSSPAKWSASYKLIDEEGNENDRWCVIQAISFESLGQTGSAEAGQGLYAYFYSKSYPVNKNVYARELGWNGAPVWSDGYLKPISLLAEGELPPVSAPSETPEETPEGGEVVEP